MLTCLTVNEALRQKFLDLKEGAIVVSLKCLMGSGRSTARTSRPSRNRGSSPTLKERNVRPGFPLVFTPQSDAKPQSLARRYRRDLHCHFTSVLLGQRLVGPRRGRLLLAAHEPRGLRAPEAPVRELAGRLRACHPLAPVTLRPSPPSLPLRAFPGTRIYGAPAG